jgi:prophage regulatory protein
MMTTSPPVSALLTLAQVKQLIPLSHSQLYRMMKAGTFPKPIRLSPSRIAFSAEAIQEFIAERSS